MITEGHLTAGALVFCIASLIGPVPLLAQTGEPAGTSLLDVLLFGFEMPPAAGIPGLSADAEKSVGIYRLREMRFKPRVKFPGSLDSDGPEDIIYQKHVAMERTVFSLFDTPESGRLAAEFAQNLLLLYEWEGDGGRPLAEATSADDFLAKHRGSSIAPYVHLFSGHRRLCALNSDVRPDATSNELRQIARDANRELRLCT